jgi:hypothetical protein
MQRRAFLAIARNAEPPCGSNVIWTGGGFVVSHAGILNGPTLGWSHRGRQPALETTMIGLNHDARVNGSGA